MLDFDNVTILRRWKFITSFDYSTDAVFFVGQDIEPNLTNERMVERDSIAVHDFLCDILSQPDNCVIDVDDAVPLCVAGIIENFEATTDSSESALPDGSLIISSHLETISKYNGRIFIRSRRTLYECFDPLENIVEPITLDLENMRALRELTREITQSSDKRLDSEKVQRLDQLLEELISELSAMEDDASTATMPCDFESSEVKRYQLSSERYDAATTDDLSDVSRRFITGIAELVLESGG
ncbi:hypothetical protein IKF15_01200 [Candidatus Saccharibacteria bacterium]|nr:hypothetical protein [Candidatus Saccharibacteria bacterium]